MTTRSKNTYDIFQGLALTFSTQELPLVGTCPLFPMVYYYAFVSVKCLY